MPFAAATSTHPLLTHAIGEVVGHVLDRVGSAPDAAFLFVTAPHGGALEDAARAVGALLGPQALIGATAGAIVGALDPPGGAAVALWAGSGLGPVAARHLRDGDAGNALTGAGCAVALCHPTDFAVQEWLDGLDLTAATDGAPAPPVVGGVVTPPAHGPTRLVVDDRVVLDGAVALTFADGPHRPLALVAQGCRPIGDPFVVTAAERDRIFELGGRPALERLLATVDRLPPEDRRLAARGLHLGVVVDERRETFAAADFVVRSVLGADRANGAIAVAGGVDLGAIVQFEVGDPGWAQGELTDVLTEVDPAGLVVFSDVRRARTLFAGVHDDSELLAELTSGRSVTGIACTRGIAPAGGRNRLHELAVCLAAFGARP